MQTDKVNNFKLKNEHQLCEGREKMIRSAKINKREKVHYRTLSRNIMLFRRCPFVVLQDKIVSYLFLSRFFVIHTIKKVFHAIYIFL